jgi:hypothetical protein
MRIAENAHGAPLLRVAIAALAAETAGLCAAVIFNIVDSVSGRSWTTGNAAGFIAVELIVAAGVAAIAAGVARVRPWSRTPAAMVQVFTVFIAIWLLDAHRFGWGIPALVLAAAGLAGLFAPASLRALARPDEP